MKYSITETEKKQNQSKNSPMNSIELQRQKVFLDEAIEPNDPNWASKLIDYQNSKKVFHYSPNQFPKHITKKMIANSQRDFDPITQKFYDKQKEDKFTKNSRNAKINMISQGYDNQLEEETTYDIINLRNKLDYFKFEEAPKKTEGGFAKNENQFNFEKANVKPYNIISNLSLRTHNYLKPALRPENDNELMKSNEGLGYKKENLLNKQSLDERYARDYNIINCKYKLFDDEKKKTDRQIQNLNALRKMQNMKTYDIIIGKYKNQNLEQKLIEKEKLEKDKKTSGVRDKNYIVRNPLNNIVYDQEEQKRLDQIEYDKKLRFLSEGYVNDYYHSKHNNLESRQLINYQHYFNPFEYKMNNLRGYDILTNKSQTILEGNKYLTEIQTKKLETTWDKIKNNSDSKNNTFKDGKLYKSGYDTSDIDIDYSNYLSKRKPILEQRSRTIDIINKNSNKEGKNNNILNTINNTSNTTRNCVHNKYENMVNYNPKKNGIIDKYSFFGTVKKYI